LRPPQAFSIFDGGRTAAGQPAGAPVRFSLFFFRGEPGGADDATSIDAEVGVLAGLERSSSGYGRRSGFRRISGCFRGIAASAECPWSIDHETSSAEAVEMQTAETNNAPRIVRILQNLLELRRSRRLLLSEEC
jgi:hypothetical protein